MKNQTPPLLTPAQLYGEEPPPTFAETQAKVAEAEDKIQADGLRAAKGLLMSNGRRETAEHLKHNPSPPPLPAPSLSEEENRLTNDWFVLAVERGGAKKNDESGG
jgi:hypothetical protein